MHDIQLSPHFKLSEFIKSATAKLRGIDNTPSLEVVSNLQQLCFNVLEPLREHFGVPIIINSGYRCPQLNAAVGGVKNSQHMTGEACDIHLTSVDVGRKWFAWIMDNLRFDQVIWEPIASTSQTRWIHVSFSRSHNRQIVIS